jgi:hypothetical protein
VQNGVSVDTSMGMTPLEGWAARCCPAPGPAACLPAAELLVLAELLASSLPAPPLAQPHTAFTPGPRPGRRLIMGTRSGDIDPAIVLHLMSSLGMKTK